MKIATKASATIFLQIVLVLFGIGVLAFLIWEPNVEGRNAHATLFEVYLTDPFLAYMYVASIPFFFGLYQAFKVLGYARRDRIFSPAAVKALRTIRYCALVTVGVIAAADVFFIVASRSNGEDPAGAVALGAAAIFASIVAAAAAFVFEGILQSAVEMKSKPN